MSLKKPEHGDANYLKVKYMQLEMLALSELLKNLGSPRATSIAADLDSFRCIELPLLFGHKDGS